MKFKRRAEPADSGDNLLPIMSLMLILIPFLVGNMGFMSFKSVEITVPGQSQAPAEEPQNQKTRSVLLQMNIGPKDVNLDLMDEETADIIQNLKIARNKALNNKLAAELRKLKTHYLKLETLLVTVDDSISYRDLIPVLDASKQPETHPVGQKPLNIVLLPKGSI